MLLKMFRSHVSLIPLIALGVVPTQSRAELQMIWKGAQSDQGIYHSTFGGVGQPSWSAQRRINGVGTSEGPALSATTPVTSDTGFNQRRDIFSAWKGVQGDSGIYWASAFGAQRRVDGVGTSHGPALATQLNRYLYMAWKGIPGDSGIYWSFMGLGPGEGRWAPQARVSNVGTSDKPALAYAFPTLFMAWKGIQGDSGIYFSANGGGASWTPQRRIPGVGTSAGPALAAFNGTLHMVWKGARDDSGIYHSMSRDNGVTWTPQSRVSGVGTTHSPALAVHNNRLFMTWKGISGDSGLYWTSSGDGTNWAPQARVSGVGTSHGPALVSH